MAYISATEGYLVQLKGLNVFYNNSSPKQNENYFDHITL